MKIIGIGGTNGSGKDSLGQFLADEYGWLFVSVTDILRAELKQRNLKPARQHMRELSAEWRRKFGHGVLVDKAFKIFEFQPAKYKGLAVASLRNPGEADEVHKIGGQVVWLDGDPKVRYDRIQANLHHRGRHRSVDDEKNFEQFLQDEAAEMHHRGGDDATLNMAGVKAKADIFIINNSDDIEQFKQTAKTALAKYL